MSEDRQPAPLAGVADLEAAGYARLPEALRAYVTGGAGEMRTVAANRAAFGGYNLVPRLFGEVAGGHTRRALFGEELAHPFIVAPTALHRLAHPEGECETARAVAAQDGLMIVSTQSSMPLDRIATTGVRFWFQLYLQPHPQATRLLISRAEEAGARAIVVTADAPVAGLRYAEQRAGFTPPIDIRPVLLDDLPKADPVGIRPDQSPVFDGIMASAPRWSDFAETCAATRLPVLLKGVMTAQDARRALDAGAAGVIVSNHGGRALDGVAATLDALPAIAEAVGGDAVVLMDGGIRSGGDAFTAMALGADAVGIGRPVYAGLAAAGEDGVRFLLSTLRHELEVMMALCGTRVLDEIAAACVQEARPAPR